ncbi:hypothetical protein [Nitrosospira briensis]|uniref:hypothetical protein n=1 Tax=Nitrosospira briensis TaxID=35799 RepID=UPI0008EF7A34|nr:hypothetical protein [Nitrosospira briensis]SFO36316.1 hypothetical protein SAMN05216332_11213 [Nitrosospira briensis]
MPIKFNADHDRAERVLLEVAGHRTVSISSLGEEALQEMERRYFMKPADMKPKVYYRLTDNWLELTVRYRPRFRDSGIEGSDEPRHFKGHD